MSKYLLIQSRSPWEACCDATYFASLARDLAAAGNDVTIYLVQNGVMAARAGAEDKAGLGSVGKARILADDFSLRERGIQAGALRSGVTASPIDAVVEMLASGAKAIWN